MLSTASATRLPRRIGTRGFIMQVLPTLVTAGAAYFLKDSISLADQMERNEVHQTMSENDKILAEAAKTKKPTFTRPPPNYPGHIPLYNTEKALMFLAAAAGSYLHPERNEFIVALGESTATVGFLKRLRAAMLSDPDGRRILKERPNITSETLQMDKLAQMPENSFGRTYYEWLKKEGVSPDTRVPVRYIDDEELAYVFKRYRQCHDFYHAITGLPIVREGEIAVKLFEYLNMGIPFAGMGAIFSPLTLSSKQRNRLLSVYYPWAFESAAHAKKNLINMYWEEVMSEDVDQLRQELGISKPPDMREMRRQAKLKRQAERDAQARRRGRAPN